MCTGSPYCVSSNLCYPWIRTVQSISYLAVMCWWRTSSYDGGRMTSSVVSSCEVGEVTAGLAGEPTPPAPVLGAGWSGEPITTSYAGGRSAAALRGPRLEESCSRTSWRRLPPLSRHAWARAWRSSSARWIAVSIIARINTRATVPPMMYAATMMISRKPCISDRAKSTPVGHSAANIISLLYIYLCKNTPTNGTLC